MILGITIKMIFLRLFITRAVSIRIQLKLKVWVFRFLFSFILNLCNFVLCCFVSNFVLINNTANTLFSFLYVTNFFHLFFSAWNVLWFYILSIGDVSHLLVFWNLSFFSWRYFTHIFIFVNCTASTNRHNLYLIILFAWLITFVYRLIFRLPNTWITHKVRSILVPLFWQQFIVTLLLLVYFWHRSTVLT